jgi:hypothetical protein
MNIPGRSNLMNSYLLDKMDFSTSMGSNLLSSVYRLIASATSADARFGLEDRHTYLLAPSTISPTPAETATTDLQLPRFDMLKPLRNWLDNLDVSSPSLAHKLCQIIPSQCPFERNITLFGHTLLHIPPMCKLNPLYEEVVTLRFKAMCYLADECGEDISQYC